MQQFIKIIYNFILFQMAFNLIFTLFIDGLRILFSILIMLIVTFQPYDVEAMILFYLYILILFCIPINLFIMLSFMNIYYDRLFELERNLDILCSYHMISQCFLQFVSPLTNHQLLRYLPKLIYIFTYPKNIYSAILPPRATQS